jgi:hypothetical protein
MDLRVVDSVVVEAITRCEDSGVEVDRETARTMLVAEAQLLETGISCDLIGRLIGLYQRKQELCKKGVIVE